MPHSERKRDLSMNEVWFENNLVCNEFKKKQNQVKNILQIYSGKNIF